MQLNRIEFHHLPSEILTRIFSLLNFRQRIRLERICRIWRQTALAFAWLEVRTLKVTNRVLNPFNRPSRSLGKLTAILRRCGPYLEELHLGTGIGVEIRFGRYFQQLPVYQKLAHLRIDESLDIWHLQQITQHVAPQLISLSINLLPKSARKRYQKMSARQMALKRELAKLFENCQKLECLRISKLGDLFMDKAEEDQGCPFIVLLPKTVKYLQIWSEHNWNENNNSIKLFTLLNGELFPNVQYFLCNSYFEMDDELLGSTKIYERIYSLQWPFLFPQNYSFFELNLPIFHQLQALHLNCHMNYFRLIQLAEICPQLEHLYFYVSYDEWTEPPRLRELEGLYAFQQLSSLAISMQMRHYDTTFHELECANGEKGDTILMEILTKLNQIHPLRSLDFKPNQFSYYYYPNLHEEYILELLQKLRHLETFSCAIQPHRKINVNYLDLLYPQYPFNNEQVYWGNEDIQINLDEFFAKLKVILDDQMEIDQKCSKKSFKFTLLKSRTSNLQPNNRILAKWIPNCEKIRWKIISLIHDNDYQMNTAYSIVLNELMDKIFDQRIRRFSLILLNEEGNQHGALHWFQCSQKCIIAIIM